MFLFLPLALADIEIDPLVAIETIAPTEGATDVPVDTLPLIVLNPAITSTVTVTLTEVATGTVIVEQTTTLGVEPALLTLDPGGPLAEGTAYRIDVDLPAEALVSVGFTTGSGLAVEVPAPALTEDPRFTLTFDREVVAGTLELTTDTSTSPFATFLLRDADSGAISAAVLDLDHEGVLEPYTELAVAERPQEQCYTAEAIDLAGRVSVGNTACFEVNGLLGCSTAPVGAGAWIVGIALGLAAARRR